MNDLRDLDCLVDLRSAYLALVMVEYVKQLAEVSVLERVGRVTSRSFTLRVLLRKRVCLVSLGKMDSIAHTHQA